MKVNKDILEDKKEALTAKYQQDLSILYTYELHKIFTWFVKNFPKRHLRWVSAMGSNFFVLDGNIFDTDIMRLDTSGYRSVWREAELSRYQKVLKPLVDLDSSINDVTNTSDGGWIQTCDINSNDYKFNPDYHPVHDEEL